VPNQRGFRGRGRGGQFNQ
jgi:hypothetical protein